MEIEDLLYSNNQLTIENINLIEKNKQLKERIYKAIDYIEIQQKIFGDYDIISENQLKNLLEILKGDSNE